MQQYKEINREEKYIDENGDMGKKTIIGMETSTTDISESPNKIGIERSTTNKFDKIGLERRTSIGSETSTTTLPLIKLKGHKSSDHNNYAADEQDGDSDSSNESFCWKPSRPNTSKLKTLGLSKGFTTFQK